MHEGGKFTIQAGQAQHVSASWRPHGGEAGPDPEARWSIDNPAVASLSTTGPSWETTVTGLAPGQTWLTITHRDGGRTRLHLTVEDRGGGHGMVTAH